MVNLLSLLLVSVAGLFAIPVCLFCLEILAAILYAATATAAKKIGISSYALPYWFRHITKVRGLLATLNDIRAQLRSGDRCWL